MSPKVTEEHKEQRRLEILKAAEEVFKRKGYEPTSMQDIIEEARMSRGGVYLYFSGKEDVFRALLDQLDAGQGLWYGELLAQTKTAWEAVERFLAVLEEQVQTVADSLTPVVYEYVSSSWRDPSRRAYFTRRYELAIAQATAFLQACVERGDFRPEIPLESVARFVISFFDGLHMDVLLLGADKVDVKDQIDSLRRYLRAVLQSV